MKILLATDSSAHSDAAVALLKRLPLPSNSEITLLTIVDIVTPTLVSEPALQIEMREALEKLPPRMRQGAEQLLRRQALLLEKTGLVLNAEVQEGYPADQILRPVAD